jgi:hypothetical protein
MPSGDCAQLVEDPSLPTPAGRSVALRDCQADLTSCAHKPLPERAELRTFLDHELPDWLATIDPVNAPTLKNCRETCRHANILTPRLRLLEAAKSAVARFDDVDVIASPTAMFTPNVLTAEAGPEKVWARNRNLVHNLVGELFGIGRDDLARGP